MSVFEASGAELSLAAITKRSTPADSSTALSKPASTATGKCGTSILAPIPTQPSPAKSAIPRMSLNQAAQLRPSRPATPIGPGKRRMATSSGKLRLPDGPRRTLSRYSGRARIADLAVAGLAATLAVGVRLGTTPGMYLLLPLALPLAWLSAVWLYRAYEHRYVGEGPEEFHRLFRAGLLLFTVVAVLSYLLNGDFSRTIAMISVPATALGSMLARLLLRHLLQRERAAGHGLHRTLVVGRRDAALSLIDSLRATARRGYHHGLVPVGVCIPSAGHSSTAPVHDVPVLGTPENVLSAIDRTGADLVAVVSHPDLSGHALRRLSWALEARGVELLVSPGIVEVAGPRLSIRPVAGLSLLHLERPVLKGSRRVM
jgi:hypothetical protein